MPVSASDVAQEQYPVLKNLGIVYKNSFGKGGSNKLEFWPPGEAGEPNAPRPNDIPLHKPGVEIYDPNIGPLDVLGDVVSHHMIHTDPTIGKIYQNFGASLTPDQRQRLQQQYEHARQNEGETRDYPSWESSAGLPAYFRGYPFQQWPAEFNAQAYTPEQRKSLDGMMDYLRGQPSDSQAQGMGLLPGKWFEPPQQSGLLPGMR